MAPRARWQNEPHGCTPTSAAGKALNELAGELRDINQGTEGRALQALREGNAAGNGQDINLTGAVMGWIFILAAKERLAYHEEPLQMPVGPWQLPTPHGGNPRGWTHMVQEEAQIYPMHHPRANFLFASPSLSPCMGGWGGLGKPMCYFTSLQPAPVHSYTLLYLPCLGREAGGDTHSLDTPQPGEGGNRIMGTLHGPDAGPGQTHPISLVPKSSCALPPLSMLSKDMIQHKTVRPGQGNA